jgi:GntR family transcriptional regulator, arabinose operon transcriptional repressor
MRGINVEREPLYIQIQNHYRGLIQSGKLQGGDKIPTEKEIAEQFDVSRITVANAINELAREGWIYRIPGRGSYVKGIPESNGSKAKSTPSERDEPSIQPARPKIGLVFPHVEDMFAIRLIRGISYVIESSGYSLVMMFSLNSKEREVEIIQELKHKVEGLIIFPVDAEIYNEEIIGLKMSGYPFVLIDRYFPGVETNVVYSDNVLASKLAVDHLWKLGHRNIAICSDTPASTVTVDDRISGYMKALVEKGALINPAMILNDFDSELPFEDPEHPFYKFVKSRMATAYIVLNSPFGVRLWTITQKLGLSVPGDLSIVTFDNPGEMPDERSLFTHIDQSESHIGAKAGQLILEAVNGGLTGGATRKIVIEPTLAVQRSTGQVPESV